MKFELRGSAVRLAAWSWAMAIALSACGGGGGGASSATPAPGTQANSAPTQVGLLAITSQDSQSLTAVWPPAQDDSTPAAALRYQVHAGSTADFVPDASTLKFEGTGVGSALIQGLQAGTGYQLKLVVLDGAGAATTSAAMAGKTADVPSQRVQGTALVATPADAAVQPTVTAGSLAFPTAAAPAAKAGDVLVGGAGTGYLRKVLAVASSGGQTVYTTAPAALNQVFTAVELSSTVKLAAAVRPDLASAQGVSTDAEGSVQTRHWPQAGLSLSAPVAPLQAANAKRAQAVTQGANAVLADGSYGWAVGPKSVTAVSGDVAELPFDIRSRSPEVKVCKLEYLDATPHAGGSDPGGLVALGTRTVKSTLASGEPSWMVQGLKLTPTEAHVLASDYYVVRARVYLDDAGDDCQSTFNFYKEKFDFSFNLAVTRPGEALPSSYDSSVQWSGDFSVNNRISFNFDPVIESSLKISGASLQSASSRISGAMGVTQELTINASGAGKLTPQTKVLSPTRTFRKVFLVGEIPVVVSGNFTLKGRIEGDVTGAMNITETFNYGFPDFALGVQYVNGQWQTVQQLTPRYDLTIKGSGEAQAHLTVTLIPEFTVSAYEAATGRLTLEPAVTAQAQIEGHFLFQDANGAVATDADYRFTAMDVTGGAKAFLMADFSVWDTTLAAWPSQAKPDDISTWKAIDAIAPTKILGLPALVATVDVGQQRTGDAKTALVTLTANPVPNPLNLVDHAPLIGFGNWLTPYVVQPTQGLTIQASEAGGTTNTLKLWVSYVTPGRYTVRVPAQSMLKLRQYVDVDVVIPDTNGDGMADPWASHYGVTSASADPNHDGRSNLVEFQDNTDPLALRNTPQINASVASASVGQQVLLWISDAYAAARTVVWDLGNGVQQAAVAIDARFAAVFESSGAKALVARLQDSASQLIATVQASFTVQAPAVPVVTGVSPATAVAGTTVTFTVSGSHLVPGLGFALADCNQVGEIESSGSASQRQFACHFAADAAPGPKDGAVGAVGSSGNPFASALKSFSVTLRAAALQAAVPSEVTRATATTLALSGTDLPTEGLALSVAGDARASCEPPTAVSATGMRVVCQFFKLGTQALELRQGSLLVGSTAITVRSNVSGVSWTSASTASSGPVKFGETVVFQVAGSHLLADAQLGFAVELCGVSNTEVGTPSDTVRSFSCVFNSAGGAVAGLMPGVVKDAPGGQVLLDGWRVPVEVPANGANGSKLPGSGVTAAQCLAAGSSRLVACSSAQALALSDQQDGMLAPGASAMSYGLVPNAQGGSYATTECVKDHITGLVWEGKTADGGLRDKSRTYTHYDSAVYGTPAQAAAATNTLGYVAQVNALGLCGFSDWRLPTELELQSIVDYGQGRLWSGAPRPPAVNATWFPNTVDSLYWSSAAYPYNNSYGWIVDFGSGGVGMASEGRTRPSHVRLVRGATASREFVVRTVAYPGDAANNAVYDTRSGLVWRRCDEGMAWTGSSCSGTTATYSGSSAFARANAVGGGWRLPNIKELASLSNRSLRSVIGNTPHSFDLAAFPAPYYGYWASTPYTPSDGYGLQQWLLQARDGGTMAFDPALPSIYGVILVRSN